MHHFASLLLKLSQQLKLQEHHFKKRPNVPFIGHYFKTFSAIPTSKTSFQIASECIICRPLTAIPDAEGGGVTSSCLTLLLL